MVIGPKKETNYDSRKKKSNNVDIEKLRAEKKCFKCKQPWSKTFVYFVDFDRCYFDCEIAFRTKDGRSDSHRPFSRTVVQYVTRSIKPICTYVIAG